VCVSVTEIKASVTCINVGLHSCFWNPSLSQSILVYVPSSVSCQTKQYDFTL